MEKENITLAVNSAASMGFEQGYGQALHFIREYIGDKRDGSEFIPLSPETRKHVLLMLLALEGHAAQSRMEFMERFHCDVVTIIEDDEDNLLPRQ